ncbi:MAG: TonB-dependent receptor, partial [Candidatus Latescibacteria bacterium]|nr:TonB-dependent receptor [Candidatus Latescibacterota bacterium]
VFLAPGPLSEALENGITENLKDPANASLAIAIGLLDQLNLPDLGLIGNGNGTGIDELTQVFVSNAAGIPFGTMSAEQASDPTAVMVAYRNFGRITLYGADLSFAYYPNEIWTFTGNYSYVSDDWFPNLDNIGDIALNAPQHKFNIGVDCQLPNIPLTIRGKLSYRDGFPMQSGVYVGDVEAYTVLDLSTSYQLPISHDRFKITWNVEASNVLNQEYRSFIGAPFIGRLLLTGLNIRF